jgi:hypothetical protein
LTSSTSDVTATVHSNENLHGFRSSYSGKDFLADFALAPYIHVKRQTLTIVRLDLSGTPAAVRAAAKRVYSINHGVAKYPFAGCTT